MVMELWNSVEILSNTCQYNIFGTYLGYWGFLIAQIPKASEQLFKTTRYKSYCEKLGTSHDVISFPIGSFLEHFVVKIRNDYLC